MTSKERVLRAIRFEGPDRVPYNFDSNRVPESEVKYGEDFEWVFASESKHFIPMDAEPNTRQTEWGVVYRTINTQLGEPCRYPLADLSAVRTFKFPDFSETERYEKAREQIRRNPDKYILGMFPNFLFMHLLDLVGFEKLMVSFVEEEDLLEELISKLTEGCWQVVEKFAQIGVNGMIAIEDLGLQKSLFISPQMWRRFFKPSYEKIIRKVHEAGMQFFIHSCGYIFDLIEDFIEIGTDVLQIDQQDNMGIDRLDETYGGRICFFCPCDIQTVLPKGNFAEIEERVKKLIGAFGRYGGGFMAKTYPMPASINITEESTKYMCDMFKKWGKYEKK